MNRKPLQGPCQHCEGTIRFPVEMVGTEAQCPYCGRQTELRLPEPESAPVIPRRAIVWTCVAVLILLAGVAAVLYALNRARLMARENPPAALQAPTPGPVLPR